MDTVVYLVRHAEICAKSNFRNVDVKEEVHGENQILSVSGEEKAKALSELEYLQNIDTIYSSNCAKSLATAKYIAQDNNTIINVDERLNERKIGNIGDMELRDYLRLQMKNFDYKLPNGESLNETKKRMVDALKNILMFESGNRIVVFSHSMALTCLLSAWCDMGFNYDGEIILSYNEETIVDGRWTAPMVIEVTFDGMNVKNIRLLDLEM